MLAGEGKGFTLLELLIAMAVGLVIMAVAVSLFRQGIEGMDTVTQRVEMQQNARTGINWMAQDISMAGTGVPQGGIQLPSGAGSQDSRFGCDQATCYILNNIYADDRLYPVTPGDGLGPTINGITTDTITLMYDDVRMDLAQLPLVDATPSGNQIRINPATNPPITDPAVGIVIGDILSICNTNGCAAGVVTNIPGNEFIDFANNDPLNFNQPSAAFGNIASILDPPNGPAIPETRARRILVITYFINVPPGPDGVVGTADDWPPRLMRQVNAHPPVPVAEGVENLQVTYDIFDENLGAATTGLPNANGLPNQIRKVTINLGVRSPQRGVFNRSFERLALSTSVTPRNMSFRDRYE
ncbi:MAG TPA: prepilin-type N-terminal cleavage/methylation domain-containing protein [Terriglobia bacterium]|nr:prepilin-type N-terminal cleavage/methylation domain-containing protein [Terriglobia bacterium]